MTVAIPTTSGYADYEQEIALGGVVYRMRLTYNSRDLSWYLSLYTAAGDTVILGQRVRLEHPLLDQYVGDEMPAGVFLVWDAAGVHVEPGRYGLDAAQAPLLFFDNAELGR